MKKDDTNYLDAVLDKYLHHFIKKMQPLDETIPISYDKLTAMASDITASATEFLTFNEDIHLSIQESIMFALRFFEQLDKKYYEEAKKIIELNLISFYNKKDIGYKDLFDSARICSDSEGFHIFIFTNHTLYDAYCLVHEITHAFNAGVYKYIDTQSYLCEILPIFFENLFLNYVEEDIGQRRAILDIKSKRFNNTCFCASYCLAHGFLINDFTHNNKRAVLSKLEKSVNRNEAKQFVANSLLQDKTNIDVSARYVIGSLLAHKLLREYKKDPNQTLITAKNLNDSLGKTTFKDSLAIIGVEHLIDCPDITKDYAYQKILNVYARDIDKHYVKVKNLNERSK